MAGAVGVMSLVITSMLAVKINRITSMEPVMPFCVAICISLFCSTLTAAGGMLSTSSGIHTVSGSRSVSDMYCAIMPVE